MISSLWKITWNINLSGLKAVLFSAAFAVQQWPQGSVIWRDGHKDILENLANCTNSSKQIQGRIKAWLSDVFFDFLNLFLRLLEQAKLEHS